MHVNRSLANLFSVLLLGTVLSGLAGPVAAHANPGPRFPDVLVISVDTLRTDRLSGYGYHRPTTPAIDALLERGARFTDARTVEPLTGPSVASMVTSRFPHEHGATRNGLRLRPGLASWTNLLEERGYRTAAFVGNWTLKDELSGLAEHFEEYHEVFTRKRWFGLFNSEATGEDLTTDTLEWIEEREEQDEHDPWLAWVHYVEPHSPYRLWEDLTRPLGLDVSRGASESDRYDTEVAYVDREVDRLLSGLGELGVDPDGTLILFVSDHGESLGEHDFWGHGRYVYENSLHIPMGIVWPGRVPATAVPQPALNIDLPPTVLGLLGLPSPDGFRGFDWSSVWRGEAEAPVRTTHYQAHKGAVQIDHESAEARRDGLLEVGVLKGDVKEIYDRRDGTVRRYDLSEDPGEVRDLAAEGEEPSEELRLWLEAVRTGLDAASDLPVPELDAESREHLEALGYID